MLTLIGRNLLPLCPALYTCTRCLQLQKHSRAAPVCPWCTGDTLGIHQCAVPASTQLNYIVSLAKTRRLPLTAEDCIMPPETKNPLTVAQRIARAKQQGVCAPIAPGALYWDVPGTVGKDDDVHYRHAYMEHGGETLTVFKLETGLAGRLFVCPAAFRLWVENWHQFIAKTHDAFCTLPWLEVPLGIYTAVVTVPPPMLWVCDYTHMFDCLAIDTPEFIPGKLPLLGFEWGVTRVLPREYRATLDMGADFVAAQALTYGYTENRVCPASVVDLRAERKYAAERIRRQQDNTQ